VRLLYRRHEGRPALGIINWDVRPTEFQLSVYPLFVLRYRRKEYRERLGLSSWCVSIW